MEVCVPAQCRLTGLWEHLGSALYLTSDCALQAHLLLEAQLLEGTTSSLVHMGMGSLPASLAADVRRNVGAFLLENIEERMQANGSGAAKTVRGAWEQAHAVLLLQAIGHPAAARYGLPGPAEASTVGSQLRAGHCSTANSTPNTTPPVTCMKVTRVQILQGESNPYMHQH